MLNMLDDCSRLFTASKLYERELLLAYFDFLPPAFLHYGLPLELYVDYPSLFFSSQPEALTQLGWALHFYGVTFRYAPTPQAKGKIEREHQFWQQRLPAYFVSESITHLDQANPHIEALRLHRNRHETPRELQMKTPTRLGSRQKGRPLGLAPGALLPLVALRLEPTDPHSSRFGWTCPHRLPAPPPRSLSRHPPYPLPPSLGPPLHPGGSAHPKHQTHRPLL